MNQKPKIWSSSKAEQIINSLFMDNIGFVFLIVDSLLLFVMCTVTLQRLRDSVT